ncbi:MAG: alpha/beta fold hydrolase, partial [Bacteroidota bacterium]
AAFPYASQYITLGDHQMHYVESGEGDPVLLLHGIPSSTYVWRNVIDKIDDDKQVIALDLIGFGKSSFPKDSIVTAAMQYEMLRAFIEAKNLKNVTLFMHDLGSIVGMMYATRVPENVKAIALFEAPFMPTDQFYRQLPFTMKLVMKLTRKRKKAEKLYMEKNMVGEKFPQILAGRKLTDEEAANYAQPFEDKERRYIMLTGPEPAQMSFDKGKGNTEFEQLINGLSEEFRKTELPILYFYARKGTLNRKAAVEYARANFKNYQEVYLGKGKHLFPETHPRQMSDAFNAWYKTLR